MPPAYFPLVQALNGVRNPLCLTDPRLGALRPLLPSWAHRLPPQPEAPADFRARLQQLLEALVTLLAACGPTVLVIDDLHWADLASLSALAHLAGRLPAQVSVLLACRQEEAAAEETGSAGLLAQLRGIAVRIHLAPLTVADTRNLLAGLLHVRQVSRPFADIVHTATAGLPIAIEELVRFLLARDLLPQAGSWTLAPDLTGHEVAPGPAEAVRARLVGLSPATRQLLALVAAVELPVAESELGGLIGMSPAAVRDARSEALHAGMLLALDGQLAIRHSIIRSVIETELLPGHRRRAHRRAAAVLAARPGSPAALLAEHHRLAGARQEWMHYAEQAADEACQVYDTHSASRLLLELLDQPNLTEAAEVRLAGKFSLLGATGDTSYGTTPATQCLLNNEPRRLAAPLRGALRFDLARQLIATAEPDSAAELWRRTVSELGDDHPLSVMALCYLALPYSAGATQWQRHRWLARAGRAARKLDSRLANDFYRCYKATAELSVGYVAGWRALAAARERIGDSAFSQQTLAMTLANVAEAAADLGHHQRAGEFLEEALTLVEKHGYDFLRPQLAATGVWLDYASGNWRELRPNPAAQPGVPDRSSQLRCELVRQLLAIERSGSSTPARWSACHELASAALCHAKLPVALRSWAAVACGQLAAGQAAEAQRTAAAALTVAIDRGAWPWAGEPLLALVDALGQQGELGRARRVVELVGRGVRGRDAPAVRAQLLAARASISARSEAAPAAARKWLLTATAYDALPASYPAALARERAGVLLGSRSRQAHHLLHAAFIGFEATGASRAARRVTRLLNRPVSGDGSVARI